MFTNQRPQKKVEKKNCLREIAALASDGGPEVTVG